MYALELNQFLLAWAASRISVLIAALSTQHKVLADSLVGAWLICPCQSYACQGISCMTHAACYIRSVYHMGHLVLERSEFTQDCLQLHPTHRFTSKDCPVPGNSCKNKSRFLLFCGKRSIVPTYRTVGNNRSTLPKLSAVGAEVDWA